MIQGIVFDLDDTLYEQQVPFAAAIHRQFPTFPTEKMKELFLRFRYYSDFYYLKSTSGEWSIEKLRYERIRLALQDFSFESNDTALKDFQKAYDEALQTISLPSETVTLLDHLTQQKIPLGIITNGPVLRQTNKIQALGLTKWIPQEQILISDQVNIQKPDPAIFHLMQPKLALPADRLLYIGDSFDNDVLGAKAADWKVWWFNHQQRSLPQGQTPIFDQEILSFSALAENLLNEKSLRH